MKQKKLVRTVRVSEKSIVVEEYLIKQILIDDEWRDIDDSEGNRYQTSHETLEYDIIDIL